LYHALAPSTALAITAAAVGTFYAIAAVSPPDIALIFGQLAQAAVAIGAAWMLARADQTALDAARMLGLVRPRAAFVLAAVLLGVSCWYLDARADDLLPWTDPESNGARVLAELVREPSLAATLVTLAIIPALCEELVFRGVLARGLATRLPPIAAAAIAALMFSAYHMSPLQALPTFLLGIVLGVLALRARSVIPAMIAHALNNALVIAMTRDDGATSAARWIEGHDGAALAGAAAIATAGLAIVVAARPA